MSIPKVLNYGSINEDRVYRVREIVRPGQTVSGLDYRLFPGGKGANQSVALGRAGVAVFHAGKVGEGGVWLRDRLGDEAVNVEWVLVANAETGHSAIQVAADGENSIVLFGGTNESITEAEMARVPDNFGAGDYLLLQNEINATGELIRLGHQRGMVVCLNWRNELGTV